MFNELPRTHHLLTQSQFSFIYTPLTSLLPYYFEANLTNQLLETYTEIFMNKYKHSNL